MGEEQDEVEDEEEEAEDEDDEVEEENALNERISHK